MKKNNEELSIKDLLSVLVPKLWLVVLVSLVFAAVFGCYVGLIKNDSYTASAKIMVTKDTSGSSTANDRVLASDMIELFSVMITESNEIKSFVILKLTEQYPDFYDDSLSVSALSSMIKVTQLGQTEVFVLSVTSESPEKSYALAQIIADYIVSDDEDEASSIKSKITYTDIKATIIDHPSSNISVNNRKVFMNTVIGFLVGAVLTIVFVYIYDNFDVKIRNRKRLDDNFDLPVLGVIPKFNVEGGKN